MGQLPSLLLFTKCQSRGLFDSYRDEVLTLACSHLRAEENSARYLGVSRNSVSPLHGPIKHTVRSTVQERVRIRAPSSACGFLQCRNPNPCINKSLGHALAMSKVRICAEWGINDIIQSWTFLDFQKKMKIFKFPVAKYYIITAFLSNMRNCFYGNQTAQYFNCNQENGTKLSLDKYLDLVNDNVENDE
jgi:hypothetical protein